MKLPATKMEFLSKPFQGSSGLYSQLRYRKMGHQSLGINISLLCSFSFTLKNYISIKTLLGIDSILSIQPVHACGAEQGTCQFMVKSLVNLDIVREED